MKNPVTHWWHQRMTAVSMLILLPWFTYHFVLSNEKHQLSCLHSKPHLLLLFILLLSAIYHMILGLNIIIDDYIHHKNWNCALKVILYIKAVILFLVGSTLLALLAFGD